jgi:hypothetical protein
VTYDEDAKEGGHRCAERTPVKDWETEGELIAMLAEAENG